MFSFSLRLLLLPSESNIKKYDLAGASTKGAAPQAARSSAAAAAPDSSVRPPGGIPEGQRIFELVNGKFKALDDLVYVLKKRILSLETNEELADAVKQFGNVGELLEDNKRLRVENQKLRAREQRFLADPLLRRRQLNTMSREQLQTLIICLQNELSASRNVLDRHTVKQVAQVRESSYIPRKNKFSHPRASLLS
jgi:regulator of replication initiation timing